MTRISDLTHLDRVGIPVFSAVAPRPNDTISVYHGKGSDKESARVSAVMEAMERWAAGLPATPAAIASFDELTAAGRAALDPLDLNVRTSDRYQSSRCISWLTAWDIANDRDVLVPHAAATYQRGSHERPLLHVITTMGIASGNTLEEAICHALCEVVERDSITTFEVAQACQRASGVLPSSSVEVDLETVPMAARELIERFENAGLRVTVLYASSDLHVPVFSALVREDSGAQIEHRGYGANPNAMIALLRALTEAAQSRAGDVEALREDSAAIELSGEDSEQILVRRDPGAQQRVDAPTRGVLDFAQIPSFVSDDLIVDIQFMVSALKSAGLDRVLICPLSPPGMPFHVVRAIVPGSETWFFDKSKLGLRALQAWNDRADLLATDQAGGRRRTETTELSE